MVVVSFSELRRAQRALERLIEADQGDNAEPPLSDKARQEVWSALEAVDRAIEKLGGAA